VSPKKIAWVLIVLASLFIGGCRITLTPIVSLSSLKDVSVRTAPVAITANTDSCTKEFLVDAADLFKANYQIKPVTCRPKGNKFEALWETEIPLLRTGDEKKIPHVPASIYYSKNHTVILTLKTEFINDLADKLKQRGVDLKDNDMYIAFIFKNDTAEAVNIAVENVFVNSIPVGKEMAIFKVKPGGSVMVRMSDIGVNSLMLGGLEAVGVFPALEPKSDGNAD